MRWLRWALCGILAVPGGAAAAERLQGYEPGVGTYFETHCIRCHGEKRQRGEFRIDEMSLDFGNHAAAGRWADVMDKISSGEMPPEEEDVLPTAEENLQVVSWLAERLKDGEASRLARRDEVSFHRLTRAEYVNTVEDLLGVRYDATDPGGLTEDADWKGFERIGSVLSLSASHVEKYFTAAETILAEAFPEKDPEAILVRKSALDLRSGPNKEEVEQLKAEGLDEKVRVDLWPGHQIQGGRPSPGRAVPAGIYKVRMQVSGLKPEGGRAPHLSFYADKLDRILFEQDIVAPEDEPVVVEFTTHLPAGNHTFVVNNDVPGPSTLPRSGRSGSAPFFSISDGRIPWQTKLTDEEGRPLHPFLILDWIEWEGPMIGETEREKRAAVFPEDDGDPAQTRESLRSFAEKAFRRPVSEEEIRRYLHLVEVEMAAGESFKSALRTALLAILCSKDFFYLVEGSAGESRLTLNEWELASRLSYFLWSTMPDEELFATARSGRLREPAVLRGQLSRMLNDPRAGQFKESFPYQWLQLKNVGMFAPDTNLYPDYDKYLEKSMVRETTAFFGEVLDRNLTLREFIRSDWTMVNPRLAHHYEMPVPDGDRFQRVALRAEDRRGGILTQASVLSLTSDGQRHRPVHRGKWVLESIFGKSPPPPPANVEPIEPNPVDAPKATIRMKLEAHLTDPNCSSCHAKFDPMGFAFENYDAIGRWRSEEVVPHGLGTNPPVDASGVLPDGREFKDAAEFLDLLMDDLDSFNGTFVEKLAIYGLRRAMTLDDREDLARIAAAGRAADFRLRDLIEAFVLSDLFQKR
jgi:hypothetical protein